MLNFTGIAAKRSTIKGFTPDSAGRAYGEIEFLKQYDKDLPLTFRLYWPNGSFKDGTLRYDVVQSGDFAEILVWVEGSYYYSGSNFYFNARSYFFISMRLVKTPTAGKYYNHDFVYYH